MKSKKIITNFLTAMRTQDNRGTAEPFFYVIRDPSYMLSDGCGDDGDGFCESERTIFKSVYHEDVFFETREELKQSLIEDHDGDECDREEDVEREIEQDYTEVAVVLKWIESGLFLTETDAEKHLKRNHYNYHEGAHVYVKHAWRTTELHDFIKALFDYFKIEKG